VKGDLHPLRDDNGSLAAGNCVNALGRSVFGQFAHCNAPAFFHAANVAIGAGKLVVPPLGTAQDGQDCPRRATSAPYAARPQYRR
jgi:hypothetical protein